MSELEDTYKHKGLRKQLVQEIAGKGITSKAVLDAIHKIPRHYFFDKIFDTHAYEDKAFPIEAGQTISQPYTVAFQTQLLEVKPGDKILEIGTGSGYQACVLLELGANVYTIEYQKKLYQKAIRFLPRIGYQPHMYQGDGSKGMHRFAPYDGIIVTAGAPTVPDELIQQLKVGGRLVIPVGNDDIQSMVLVQKIDENKIKKKQFDHFSFVPLRGEKGWPANGGIK
ncbi:MAG: protein-L-isoaspartate(D-aspartate) O-methyltransferase [Ekhidna sp.]|uniref:protein-L-isoaspartate(D-aspartate) O-methyltransferase n=1 Tax=Ekhidna sp. TaxID=2608089 RepID=UPI0032EEBA60